jgi:hypothetical protein
MEQAFRVEIKDYLQFNTYLVNRSPRLKFIRFLNRFALPLMLCGGLYASGILSSFVFAPVAIFVLFFFSSKSQLHTIFKRSYNADTTGACVIEITPEMFRFQNPEYEIRAKWEKISGVALTETHVVFMLLALRSFVIPRSAFTNEEHARAFLNAALAYQAGTLTDTPATETTAWPPPPDRRRL